jgi:hypothetical protein
MIDNTFLEKNMIGSTFWGMNMSCSTFWEKTIIGNNFCGENMTDSTSRKKHDWQHIL